LDPGKGKMELLELDLFSSPSFFLTSGKSSLRGFDDILMISIAKNALF
jgi:hypothetical protein